MVSRRGLGAGGVRCHGPRQLWAVPVRGFGWVFPLHLLHRLRRNKRSATTHCRYHSLVSVVVAVLVVIGVGCCTPVIAQCNRSVALWQHCTVAPVALALVSAMAQTRVVQLVRRCRRHLRKERRQQRRR